MHRDAEEAALERMLGERASMATEGATLDARGAEAELAVWSNGAAEAINLRALDDFRQHLASERLKLRERVAECDRRTLAQRSRVLEERRQSKLLDHLRERRRGEWQREFDKELEALAADSYLARWVRDGVA